jgi:hypothetical protein
MNFCDLPYLGNYQRGSKSQLTGNKNPSHPQLAMLAPFIRLTRRKVSETVSELQF